MVVKPVTKWYTTFGVQIRVSVPLRGNGRETSPISEIDAFLSFCFRPLTG